MLTSSNFSERLKKREGGKHFWKLDLALKLLFLTSGLHIKPFTGRSPNLKIDANF